MATEGVSRRWRCPKCSAYLDQFQTAGAAARADRAAGRRWIRGQIAMSLVLVAIGVGLTIVTSPWSSQGGGPWIVALGPIVVGMGQLFRILVHYA